MSIARQDDTIAALSSGSVPAGVAVLRLSGSRAGVLIEQLAGMRPAPRRLTLAALHVDGEVVDQALVAWFPAPRSFTGEDCAELHVHGSRAVVTLLLRWLADQAGVRLAEAGEFTRRAFENGKLDLTQVEGLGDLIEAETEGQRRLAVARLDGVLGVRIAGWRQELLDLQAEIEARLDFSDEGDVEAALPATMADRLAVLVDDFDVALATFAGGRIVREGFRVALAGPPNVGKSSLLNALARSDLAIVSDEPGTTRDVREVPLNLGGQLIVLVDMAGLREAPGKVEAEGVRRATAELARADLVLWLVAPDVAPDVIDDAPPGVAAPVWRVATKADIQRPAVAVDVILSARSGAGMDELIQRLAVAAVQGGPAPLLSRERDRQAIAAARQALVELDLGREEVAAEGLRAASQALARLIGAIDAEAVLDRLFLSFCIGK
jgi:tRNA modification GTPase